MYQPNVIHSKTRCISLSIRSGVTDVLTCLGAHSDSDVSLQREEKALDAALDAFSQRLNDLKQSIGQTLQKLEAGHEHMNWPSLLDSFALLSGQVSPVTAAFEIQRILLTASDMTAAEVT